MSLDQNGIPLRDRFRQPLTELSRLPKSVPHHRPSESGYFWEPAQALQLAHMRALSSPNSSLAASYAAFYCTTGHTGYACPLPSAPAYFKNAGADSPKVNLDDIHALPEQGFISFSLYQ